MPQDPSTAFDISGASNTLKGLVAGQMLFQRYVLEKILGRGGMGIVWLARDQRLDRFVALKVLPDEVFYDPSARDDLKHETRKSLELTHPNIVRIHDFVEDEESAAISMEYVDGATLSQMRVAAENKVLEADALGPWIRETCEALYHAHQSARLVHRDLKPANIMVNSRNQAKVTDFGIACSLHNSLRRVSIRQNTSGTIVYMSPEQMVGEQPSPLDDIYALGATIYEVITSKPPFYEGDIARQVRRSNPATMKERRVALKILGKAIPAHWEEAVAKCLSKERADRPADAMALARMLGLVEQLPWSPSQKPQAQAPGKARQFFSSCMQFLAGTKNARIATSIIVVLLAMGAGALPGLLSSSKLVNAPSPANPKPAVVAPATALLPPNKVAAAAAAPVAQATPVPAAAPAVVATVAADQATIASDHDALAHLGSPGHLVINSEPAGLQYQLFAGDMNSAQPDTAKPIREGVTPANVDDLDAGMVTVVCIRPGWPNQIQEVQIDGREDHLDIAFASGTATITSVPAGAQIFMDGQLLGVTPFTGEAPPGQHQITAKLGTKPDQTKPMFVTEGIATTLEFRFTPARSSVKKKKAPPESGWDKLGDSLKKVFHVSTSKPTPAKH